MKAILNSIEIKLSENRYTTKMLAEIEFDDEGAIAKELGLETCIDAFDNDKILEEVGIDEVKEWLEGKGVEFHEENP